MDERCARPAIGTSEGGVRVCEECAIEQHCEDFTVAYDDGRVGVAS
jgi:hypothetical protein